nr:hypothetical protein [Neisseria gonorrhoeae]
MRLSSRYWRRYWRRAMPSDSPREAEAVRQRENPADIAAMRMALAQKQAQVAELSAEIWLEERHLNAEEEAGCRRVHGDAEVPEGKE